MQQDFSTTEALAIPSVRESCRTEGVISSSALRNGESLLHNSPSQAGGDNSREVRGPGTFRVVAGYRSGDHTYQAGQDILSQGTVCEAVYNLLEGWAFLYTITKEGRRQILHFALPGAVLCFHPDRIVLSNFGVQALTDVKACVIPHQTLASLSQNDPAIGMRLASLMCQDLNLAFDHMTNIGRKSSHERVAHLLLELFVRYRLQWPGVQIDDVMIPLTQEHVSDATGLTSVHVNRVLSHLRENRIVEFRYRRLRILDLDKLVRVSGVDPERAALWLRRG